MFPFTKVIRFLKKTVDLVQPTWEKSDMPHISHSYLGANDLDLHSLDIKVVENLTEMYLAHRFDLLGSAWTQNSYNSFTPGFEGIKYSNQLNIREFDKEGKWLSNVLRKSHLGFGKKHWKLIRGEYIPIDWQKDIKSGYRWNANKWYLSQRNKYYPGADLKVPWEISRLYHLPQLAIFAIVKPEWTDVLITEFRNQVLDFISANPPRMGVNWTTTMEVAIRAINMLVSYDLFCQLDRNNILDNTFKQVFSNSIFEHGKHILNNLEYKKKLTSNHYLSNITGLLFIASYLDRNNQTSQWLLFSIQELNNEVFKQFNPDGVNFESSTSYHRLSSEMIILSLSLVLGLSKEKREGVINVDTSGWGHLKDLVPYEQQDFNLDDPQIFKEVFLERIYRSGCFARDIVKPSGEIPQFGDNDSGKILKLTPVGQIISKDSFKEKYLHIGHMDTSLSDVWDENTLIQGPLLAYFDGIFKRSGMEKAGREFPLERSVAISFSKKHTLKTPTLPDFQLHIPDKTIPFNGFKNYNERLIKPEETHQVPLNSELSFYCYPVSKFFIFKSERMYLAINAMSNGQNGNGGHCHNDKLSFELSIDGRDIFVDPGTYVYTACPDIRNLFRSVKHHNTMVIRGLEQNGWKEGIMGLFSMSNEASCEVIEYSPNSIAIQLKYKNAEQVRQIRIHNDHILIKDYSNLPFQSNYNDFKLYSNGYGKLMNFNISDERSC